MQLTLDSATLETLLKHAASASRLVGYIDDSVNGALAVGPLADRIDAIVHTLSELLGNPGLIAAPVPSARSTFAPHVVTQDDFATQGDMGAEPTVRRTLTPARGRSGAR
jgi:hypothetical protein